MAMSMRPTPSGGRVVQCDGSFGACRVEWDADGVLVSESIDLRDAMAEPAARAPDSKPSRPRKSCEAGPTLRLLRGQVGPGDALHAVIVVVTLGLVGVCGSCQTWRKRFNAAGWRGCWRLMPQWVKGTLADTTHKGPSNVTQDDN